MVIDQWFTGSLVDSKEVDIEGLWLALSQVDSLMKSPTQAVAQQGAYLAKCLSLMEKCKLNPEGPLCLVNLGAFNFVPSREGKDNQGKGDKPVNVCNRPTVA
ncbi:hypothetical protein IFM89_039169 [Coptis chinensis]|uniref:Uncharacterized protein n=1 Tax=Coptis chinensis TaxID=261450 RepID=A0A835M671_9MAGN|nr:hypothetical protein IFM89_039169 [Coptis chinensis]